MTKRKGSSTSGPRTRSKTAKEERDAKGRGTREVENARRLDKLPRELWEKIVDELDENDLFPLALSCRYFRQKQKELVERTRQDGPGSDNSRLALRTNLWRKLEKGQSASADYLQFCSKEEVPSKVARKRAKWIRCLAAYHGHLPLLQELLKPLKKLPSGFKKYAGEFSLFKSLLLCFGV